jgi:iron(II)-dependent oxidoreductase
MGRGYLSWIAGWLGLATVLSVLASAYGPGADPLRADPVQMVRVAGGPFSLGADGASPDERPLHRIELRAFEIDRLPVVNAQFASFLNAHGQAGTDPGALIDLAHSRARIVQVGTRYMVLAGFEQYPVVAETWQGARAYCAARGARLPTEAEWERAARGPDGREYPWGNEPPDASRARYSYQPFDFLPVGSYPAGATPDGILDMAGNVAQWTSTRYAPYPYQADDGREDPDTGSDRVARGSGASATADLLRASYRSAGLAQLPASKRPPITFRCARDAE